MFQVLHDQAWEVDVDGRSTRPRQEAQVQPGDAVEAVNSSGQGARRATRAGGSVRPSGQAPSNQALEHLRMTLYIFPNSQE